MIQPDLRPLSIGEILDRAVTLFVQRFAVLILILALVAIPIAIFQYASQPETTGLLADIQRLLAVPPGHPDEQREILRQLSANNHFTVTAALLVAASMILSLLSSTACVIAAAQAYAGKLPSVRDVYRDAVRRWPAQLAAVAIAVAFAFVLTIVGFLITLVVVLAVAAIGTVSRAAVLIIGIPLAILAVVIIFGVAALFYFVMQMTLVSIALEEPNPIRGIAQGVRRTLSPAVFWRSALVALIVFVVGLIGTLVLQVVAVLLSGLTHWTALTPVVAVIGEIALDALITVFIVIYAIDVRVRREGYDLVLAARETPT